MVKTRLRYVEYSALWVLTSAEMNELFLSVKAGDKTAREKLIKGNLRLYDVRFSGLPIVGRCRLILSRLDVLVDQSH